MDKDLKIKRRLMLGMGKPPRVCEEKLAATPGCVICKATPILYRVGWLGYCKLHRAEATKTATTKHLHRQVRNETQYDLVETKREAYEKKQRNVLKHKHR